MHSHTMPDFPKAVLFDFDGVLVDSEPHHFTTFTTVLRRNGLDIDKSGYYRNLLGLTDYDSFMHVYRESDQNLPGDLVDRMTQQKAQAMMQRIRQGHIQPTPGAIDFVEAMAARCPLAICSGARREEIEAVLAALELAPYFRTIVAAGEVPGKPDPAGYLLAMRQLAAHTGRRLTPSDCLIVEDSPLVIASVREVGFRVLAVACSVPAESLAHADHVVPSLDAPSARSLCSVP